MKTASHAAHIRAPLLIAALIIAPSLLSYFWIFHLSTLFTDTSYQMVSIFIYLILLSNIVVKILLSLIDEYDPRADKKNNAL